MQEYVMMKVFDLVRAPEDLREADDLASLRPVGILDNPSILCLTVGSYTSAKEGPDYDRITREVTLIEYRLHKWLLAHGAADGEDILVRWSAAC